VKIGVEKIARAEQVLAENGVDNPKAVLQKIADLLLNKDIYPEQEKNTAMVYLYRDAANWKTQNKVVLKGEITPEQVCIIRDKLIVDQFIPEQVGLPLYRDWDITQDDHCWAELDVQNGFYRTIEPPTENISVGQLVKKFQDVKFWDDLTYAV